MIIKFNFYHFPNNFYREFRSRLYSSHSLPFVYCSCKQIKITNRFSLSPATPPQNYPAPRLHPALLSRRHRHRHRQCSDWVIELVLWWFEPLVTIFFFLVGRGDFRNNLCVCITAPTKLSMGSGGCSGAGAVLRCRLSVAFGDPLKPLRWWITFDFRALRTR